MASSLGLKMNRNSHSQARTSSSKNQNAAYMQEKQVRDMIMRQIELLTNKRHLLPKSRLKRAHFGRIHKRNARKRGGIGSFKSDDRDRNRNRSTKDRSKDRK